jgi:G:T-mismatch repair DNA endonuclease (very short patch repair protein)
MNCQIQNILLTRSKPFSKIWDEKEKKIFLDDRPLLLLVSGHFFHVFQCKRILKEKINKSLQLEIFVQKVQRDSVFQFRDLNPCESRSRKGWRIKKDKMTLLFVIY